MFTRPPSRWHAFGIHLGLSLLIFIALAALIVFAWYPGFLFRTDGGWQGIRLIAGIDLVLGPLLTLIVYNQAKKSLKFDLLVIALVQFSALGAGTYLVYQERPIAVVFADGKFSTMARNSYSFHGISIDDVEILNQRKPVWVYAAIDQSHPSLGTTFGFTNAPHLATSRYRPLEDFLDRIKPLGSLDIGITEPVERDSNLRYYPVLSRYYEGYLLFDVETGKVRRTILTNSTDHYQVEAG